ncbi:hypothetical protein L1987_18514 [Smallanthus sonchifolius]|uniref:Uncharacterized protein n=1 Tax=Smallanthus sonchifolius TaxID=185202 RepID=A0ACB9J0I0_9ASTR|nr:hypothetical protein L1987_18514 [Smallanthus sonchifolius]
MVVFLLTSLKPGTAESNTTSNMMITSFCDRVDPMSPSVFFSNLNSTYASIRGQLLKDGVYFARAQNLGDADSVYGTVQCRNYLSAAQCLACFDVGVSALAHCTTGNGAYVILDDCFLSFPSPLHTLQLGQHLHHHFRLRLKNSSISGLLAAPSTAVASTVLKVDELVVVNGMVQKWLATRWAQ